MIKEELSEPNLILFGNKIDMDNRDVSEDEAKSYAKKMNLNISKHLQNYHKE